MDCNFCKMKREIDALDFDLCYSYQFFIFIFGLLCLKK